MAKTVSGPLLDIPREQTFPTSDPLFFMASAVVVAALATDAHAGRQTGETPR